MGEYGMSYTDYYNEKLQEGKEYEDFISEKLRSVGIITGIYTSKRWQLEHGESASGIEIKFDKRFKETGNLYIEVAEKSHPSMPEYSPSGIMRNDNSYLYVIGDYDQAFMFAKKQLQVIYENTQYWSKRGIQLRQTKTSKGFLFPAKSAIENNTCIRHFVFNKDKES